VLAERAVVVDAHSGDEEETVAPGQLLLRIATDVRVERRRLRRGRRLRGRRNHLDPGARESEAAKEARVGLGVVELTADRRRRRERRREIHLRRARVIGRDDRRAIDRLSDASRRRGAEEWREIRRSEALDRATVIRRVIDADDGALGEPLRELIVQRAAAGEPVRADGVVIQRLRYGRWRREVTAGGRRNEPAAEHR